MDRTIYSFKSKLLTNLPPFLSKLLYSINHKTIQFKETKYKEVEFSIYIPHTMEANYNRGHEVGVAQRFIEKYKNRKNFIFWDVGACFSYFSGMVSALNPGAKLYAFEPFVGHYMYIEKSAKAGLLKNIILTKKFIGASKESEMITLDSFSKQHQVIPNLIKVDVDGAELGVLDGCQHIISTHHPDFLIELDCNRYKLTHSSLKEVIDKYFKGYACSVLMNVHKNNTVWDQKQLDDINIAETEGDIYLHLSKLLS